MNDMIQLSPLHQLWRMQQDVDRLFTSLLPRHHGKDNADTAVWSPIADLAETDEAYLIRLDMPGIAKDEVSINYQGGTLIVSGERSDLRREGVNVIRAERRFGHFYREFNLPKAIDATGIIATYQDGVLTIEVPKAEISKPVRIKVK